VQVRTLTRRGGSARCAVHGTAMAHTDALLVPRAPLYVASSAWLARWTVTMKDRTSVVVWSDGYSEVGDDLVFGALVDASPEEQADLDVTNRTPSNPLSRDHHRALPAVGRGDSSIELTAIRLPEEWGRVKGVCAGRSLSLLLRRRAR
jgi:hypothetical protein